MLPALHMLVVVTQDTKASANMIQNTTLLTGNNYQKPLTQPLLLRRERID